CSSDLMKTYASSTIARTGTVLDDGRRRIRLHLLGSKPREDVAGSAGGKADHDARRRMQRLRKRWREAQCRRSDTGRAANQETPAIGPDHVTNVSHSHPPCCDF